MNYIILLIGCTIVAIIAFILLIIFSDWFEKE